MLIMHAEKDRFGDLQKELKMDYAKGVKNTFLTTVSDALDLLNHYKLSISNFKKKEEQIAFVTNTNDSEKKDYTNATCYRCGKKGHIRHMCKATQEDADKHAAAFAAKKEQLEKGSEKKKSASAFVTFAQAPH